MSSLPDNKKSISISESLDETENLWQAPKKSPAQVSVVPWAQSLPGLEGIRKFKELGEVRIFNGYSDCRNLFYTHLMTL